MLTDILVNFTHAAVVVFGLLTLLWAISLAARDASLIDIFWGFGFLVVASVCFYIAPAKTPYIKLLAALPIIWGLRLTLYLGKRNLGHGEDVRYVAMRKRAEKKGMSEMAWRIRSLFTIYFGQGLLIMIVSAPVWVGMATRLGFADLSDVYDVISLSGETSSESMKETISDLSVPVSIGILSILGAILWPIGFLFESIGDWQATSQIPHHIQALPK